MSEDVSARATTETYNYTVVRQFAIMTVVWGIVGMLVGVIIAAQLAWPALNFDVPYLSYGRLRPLAHQRGDLRVRRLRALRHQLLRGAAHLPDPALPRQARRVHVLGLADRDRRCGRHAAPGHHCEQGIRRARVADRHADRGGLGRLRGGLLRHDREAKTAPHLRGQLVLRRVHPRRGRAAHREQPRDAGLGPLEVVLDLLAARSMRWCSGGTGTTRWASS